MRFRFSLRLLLIVITIFAVYFTSVRLLNELRVKQEREKERIVLEGKKFGLEREKMRMDRILTLQKQTRPFPRLDDLDEQKQTQREIEEVDKRLNTLEQLEGRTQDD
jgi:hypothetical protein